MAALVLLAAASLFGALLLLLHKWMAARMCTLNPDLAGRVAVITGTTSGMGFETARRLARLHATLVLLDRDTKKSAATAAQLKVETGNEAIEVVRCDLSDLASVECAAKHVLQHYPQINLLINNAGVCYVDLSSTKQGWEMQYGTNHLGHFALTQTLLPALIRGKARVITVGSRRHRNTPEGGVDFEDGIVPEKIASRAIKGKAPYNATLWYGQSKLCNVLFCRELQRRYGQEGVSSFTLHPGVVMTEGGRYILQSLPFSSFLKFIAGLVLRTPEQGAQTQLYLSLAPLEQLVPGEYYRDCEVAWSSKLSKDETLARKLWEISEKQVQLTK